jgi:hypothetical protein
MKLDCIQEARKINLEILKLEGVKLWNISFNLYHFGKRSHMGYCAVVYGWGRGLEVFSTV